VLLTGHTGFKGTWAALWLMRSGARVTGLSLPPQGQPSFFELAKAQDGLDHRAADLRDRDAVAAIVAEARPEIVLHMAAQAIVRRAAREPIETIATNVLGTAHLLDALRTSAALRAILVVTSDKVYENAESGRSFVESDPLGGGEPYSASKAAQEFVTRAFAETGFERQGIAVATARGGNVIGGGDFGEDRLVPDIARAVADGQAPLIRNPDSTRPWQHVLDCLAGYFAYVEALAGGKDVPRALNFGPSGVGLPVRAVAEAMLTALGADAEWRKDTTVGPREARRLAIDSAAARHALGWDERLTGRDSVEWTAAWYDAWRRGEDMRVFTLAQIEAYEALAHLDTSAAAAGGRLR
jgi:CDP-glucose 4,6-dehydratase